MKKLIYIFLSLLILASCVDGSTMRKKQSKNDSDSVHVVVNIVDTVKQDSTLLSLTPQQIDSLHFRLTHHYSENFNFVVKSDSLTLIPREGDIITDTCTVYDGDVIAVAAIKAVPGDSIDSIWVKVAHDQYTMGWVPEQQLLKSVTPDDSISQLLDALSDSRFVWMSAIVLIGIATFFFHTKKVRQLQILKFREMDSIYPPLFLILVSIMATLYASVQNFVPEFWQEFYYHPSLNPLILPPIMSWLVVVMWLVVITLIAVIDEVYHHFYFLEGLRYGAELIGIAMIVYLVFSWGTLFYIGYALLPAFIFACIWIYRNKIHKKTMKDGTLND